MNLSSMHTHPLLPIVYSSQWCIPRGQIVSCTSLIHYMCSIYIYRLYMRIFRTQKYSRTACDSMELPPWNSEALGLISWKSLFLIQNSDLNRLSSIQFDKKIFIFTNIGCLFRLKISSMKHIWLDDTRRTRLKSRYFYSYRMKDDQ